jgi:hypothetical protein
MKRLGVAFLMTAILIVSTSCDNDDGTTPQAFTLTVEVVDETGAPMPGLAMSVAADLPWYQDKAGTDRAAVAIPFQVAVPCNVYLAIEDVTGAEIRLLIDEPVGAGQFLMDWNGWNVDRIHMPSGVYSVHMRAYNPGTNTLHYEDRVPMYMAIIDPERLRVGTTDADGLIALTDKRLFPNLYTPPDIPAVDATGEQVGTIEITDSVRFGFHDPASGIHRRFYADVSGSGTVQFVWSGGKAEQAPMTRGASRIETADDPPPGTFDLGQPYPNPFN